MYKPVKLAVGDYIPLGAEFMLGALWIDYYTFVYKTPIDKFEGTFKAHARTDQGDYKWRVYVPYRD